MLSLSPRQQTNMLRLLPWNAYDTSSIPTTQMFVPPSSSAKSSSPSVTAAMKRKRSDDRVGDSQSSSANKPSLKSRKQSKFVVNGPNQSTESDHSVSHVPEGLPTPLSSPTEVKMEDVQLETHEHATEGKRQRRVRQVIQQQINLEILLKHNELRLIDQELAKCQTALEQLRRCSEIPYPATRPSEAVSQGSGPALQRSFSGRLPASPAPWGVTDGPYSRHYSRWLLPDSRFDGGEPETPLSASGKRPAKGRIRGSFAEDHSVGVQSRSQRNGSLQALPAGYGQPKEKASGPLLLKRKSDGVMVKLVCPDCGRHDFGSAQGFINHCRIGHSRNFTSHDAAAEKCGEPVEYDEHGAMVGVEPTPAPTSNFVHPLIRSARLLPSERRSALPNADGASDSISTPRFSQPRVSPNFRASTLTPHLSALIKNKGFGLDLQDIVTDAKIKVELPDDDEEDLDEEAASPTPPEPNGHHPHVAGTRGITKPSKSPHTSPLLQSRLPVSSSHWGRSATSPDSERSRGPIEGEAHTLHSQTIEPSPATESNQAPSLIDDDEDFDPRSPSSSSESGEDEEGEVNFHVQDEDDSQPVAMPRSDFQPTCAQAAAPEPPTPRVRRPSALRKQAENREEKHVSFVSPSPAREVSGAERKRRKITK